MKILILFGHPAFQNSHFNLKMVEGLENIRGLTFHDLYEAYPEMDIDIDHEQQLVEEHDCIVFQHPMYWYSTPAIFKEWQDLVLEHSWAYGSKGNALDGKLFFNAITTGAPQAAFKPGSFQDHTVKDFLLPFHQMAKLCKMIPLPPFVIHGTHVINEERLRDAQQQYKKVLELISQDKVDINACLKLEYLNEIINTED